MKSCSYCGRENNEACARCFECGTSFSSNEPEIVSSEYRPSPRLFGTIRAIIGFVFIASTVIVICSRLALDMAVAEHGGPIGKPGIYGVGILALFYTVFALIFVLPVLVAACIARFGADGGGISFLGLLLLASLLSVKGLKFLLPAYLLGGLIKFPPAYYVGAAIQLGLGIWLLKSARLQPKALSTEAANQRQPV